MAAAWLPFTLNPVKSSELRRDYRPEIDGLRALAVIAVVLYHSRVPGLAGGFAGVDIFFAISGYVVIGSLLREQQRVGSVDWMRFLVRRMRRLLPLLLLTLLLSLALGYGLLPPYGQFQQLCQASIAALGLSANLFFWRSSGSYFAPHFEQLPLMHLWSLSIEEQFYLFIPALFLLARWLRSTDLTRPVLTLTVISLALAAWGAAYHPTAAFYLPVTRGWEFGVGALAALAGSKAKPWAPRWLSSLLLIGIMASLVALKPGSKLQPLLAGVPAVMTALLLWNLAARASSGVTLRLLQHEALSWIGQRAYAWYLLHWPALVFYRQYWLENVSDWELPLLSAGTLALAALAHRYVEQPLRYGSWRAMESRFRQIALVLLATTSVATTAFLLGIQASARQADPAWRLLQERQDWSAGASNCLRDINPLPAPATACATGSMHSTGETLFLWGDSHAYQFWHSLSEMSIQQDIPLRTWAMAGCPPLVNRRSGMQLDENQALTCNRFAQAAHTDILASGNHHGSIAILAARWEPYLAVNSISMSERHYYRKLFSTLDPASEEQQFSTALLATVRMLVAQKVQVILVAPVPEQLVSIPDCISRFSGPHCRTERAIVEHYRSSALRMLGRVAERYPSVQIVDPIHLFCDKDFCNPGPSNQPWYLDDDHLSVSGARRVQALLSEAVREARRRLASHAG